MQKGAFRRFYATSQKPPITTAASEHAHINERYARVRPPEKRAATQPITEEKETMAKIVPAPYAPR